MLLYSFFIFLFLQWIFFHNKFFLIREVVKPNFVFSGITHTNTNYWYCGRNVALSVINILFFCLSLVFQIFLFVDLLTKSLEYALIIYCYLNLWWLVVVFPLMLDSCVFFLVLLIFFLLYAQEHLSKTKYVEIKTMKYNSLICYMCGLYIYYIHINIYKRVVAARTQSFNCRNVFFNYYCLEEEKSICSLWCTVWVQKNVSFLSVCCFFFEFFCHSITISDTFFHSLMFCHSVQCSLSSVFHLTIINNVCIYYIDTYVYNCNHIDIYTYIFISFMLDLFDDFIEIFLFYCVFVILVCKLNEKKRLELYFFLLLLVPINNFDTVSIFSFLVPLSIFFSLNNHIYLLPFSSKHTEKRTIHTEKRQILLSSITFFPPIYWMVIIVKHKKKDFPKIL